MRSKNVRIAILATAAAASVATCGDDHSAPANVDEVINSCEGLPAGQPFASDESWTKFVEAEAAGRLTSEDCRSPALTVPAPGSTVDRNMPPTITFTGTQPACAQARGEGRGPAQACSRKPGAGRLGHLWKLISPIGVAHAHCPAVDGPNYLLRIADSADKTIYTALLSVTSFTPKADVWRKAMSGRGGQTVRVTIQRGMFVRGNIMEGPFVQKQPFTLTVAP